MRFSSIQNERRYFIRKHMKFRKPKKECGVCYIFLLTILIKKEKKYIISSPNGDFVYRGFNTAL